MNARIYLRRYPFKGVLRRHLVGIKIMAIVRIMSGLEKPVSSMKSAQDKNHPDRFKFPRKLADALHIDLYRPHCITVSPIYHKGWAALTLTDNGSVKWWANYSMRFPDGKYRTHHLSGPCGNFMSYLVGKKLKVGETVYVKVKRTTID